MQLKTFYKKINPRLILVHFAALWMFNYAFMFFFYLLNIPLLKSALYGDDSAWEQAIKAGAYKTHPIVFYFEMFYLAPVIGQLTALIISLAIVITKKWFWVNSVIAFIIVTILVSFDASGWIYLKYVFLLPGRLNGHNPYFYAIANGSVLLALGLLLFLLRKIQAFIQRSNTPSPMPLQQAA